METGPSIQLGNLLKVDPLHRVPAFLSRRKLAAAPSQDVGSEALLAVHGTSRSNGSGSGDQSTGSSVVTGSVHNVFLHSSSLFPAPLKDFVRKLSACTGGAKASAILLKKRS